MKSVLVTGATGVIGSALVPLFLQDDDTRVWALLRAQSESDLRRRTDELFAYWGEAYDAPSYRTRVISVRGDVSSPRLGLDRTVYDQLAADITHVVHCAGDVNMRLSLEEAKRISVNSAEEVMALSGRAQSIGRFQKLEFVSTLGVAGKRNGRIPEKADLGRRTFHTTYETAKAEAEQLVHERMAESLPVTVHRPSMIVGDSSTGRVRRFQIFYYICEFLTGRYTRGFLPDTGDLRVDTVPVDFVARVLKWASGCSETTGRILHVCTGGDNAMTVADITRLLGETWPKGLMAKRRVIPLPLFQVMMSAAPWFAPSQDRKALSHLRLLLEHLKANQKFENTGTVKLLRGGGLVIPQPKKYLPNVFRYYLDERRSTKGQYLQ